jgi:hypothetical protein
MIFGFGQAPDDPGRREFGTGGTRFVAPAWHEGNTISEFVRSGDRVVDAYIRGGLQEIIPPEAMLTCISDRMTVKSRWIESVGKTGRVWVVGYLRDKRLQDALARCWSVFSVGPPIGEDVTADRIILTSGLVLPSLAYQLKIHAFLAQGVSLERAYFYTGQSMITPGLLLPCMESMIQEGTPFINAARECEKMPLVTLPIPNGDDLENGEEPKKGVSTATLIRGFLLGVALLKVLGFRR